MTKSLFCLKESGVVKKWNNLEELKKYRIGGTIGYWYTELFSAKGLNVEYVASDEQNFMKLYSKRVDIVPTDEVVGNYIIEKLYSEEKEKFDIMDGVLNRSELRIMVSKKYPNYKQILEKFNNGIKKIKDNGKYNKIMEKYKINLNN